MKTENGVSKKLLTKVLVDKIKSDREPLEIRAQHLQEIKSTEKIVPSGTTNGFYPDIAVKYDKESHIYEIELDDEPKVGKWKLFSLHARKHNGNFYIVVPDWLKDNIKQQLSKENINAGLLYFNT
jgi:hypothetical protein